MTENQLIEECRAGNLSHFGELVRLTTPVAYAVAFRMTGDDDEAKDIVQDTMVTIWQKIKKIRSSEAFRTWMYRIVVNKCYDCLRLRKKNPEYKANEPEWNRLSQIIPGNYSAPLENEETAEILNIMTNSLSATQKVVFILSEIEEKTHDEISEITGFSKTSIKANLYHARKSILEMAEKYL